MRQSQFALMAMDDLKNALSSNDEDRLWYSVQAFLVAAGNISKLLWPKSNPERGQIVRQSLAVPDDSVLRDRQCPQKCPSNPLCHSLQLQSPIRSR
jgi:hypothetical protein